ncbi:MAG: NUDIX hydrolase, partial [Clostridia bacterium]
QLYTWGEVDRDPRTRVVSCSYMALVDSSQLQVQAGDDAERAEWFHIWDTLFEEKKTHTDNGYVWEKWIELKLWNDEESLSAILKITKTVDGKIVKTKREIVESRGIAFDHATMILYGLERLRNKLEYTDIVFHLMPDLFTLSELQQVYEVILGKELLAAAFRRKIAEKVQETNEYTKNAGHRPSKLYRYHAGWSDVF